MAPTDSNRDDLDVALLYEHLWAVALSRPRQYRFGIEARMRRLWKSMTDAERQAVR